MARPNRYAGVWSAARCLAAAAAAGAALSAGGFALTGCTSSTKQAAPVTRYAELPPAANLPPFMQNSVEERALVVPGSQEPFNVSSYGLVGQLRGTGDTTASNIVRQYMIKEMARHGFGDALIPGYKKVTPGDVLKDPNYAIVRVDAFIPPGARKEDWIDAQVSCLPGNRTTSLGRGVLFETDLKEGGADVDNPSGAVNVFVRVKGPIVVNPAYALENPSTARPQARASLRTGTVMFNARVMQDRPLLLQLRQPQRTLARAIEGIVRQRFQDDTVARAQDEGLVELYVPRAYRGDWRRFGEVVRHLFLRNDPDFNAAKSRTLAAEAIKPGVSAEALEHIGYCWEGIGGHALPHVLPLLTHADPRVAFHAARAAAFIGDGAGAAEQRLMQMARTPAHPYRLTAVRTLGSLPGSSSLNHLLRDLLNADQATIRVEAYHILARNRDPSVVSTVVAPAINPSDQKFILDRVYTDAPPLVYVTRTGVPRIALLGRTPDLGLPVPFTAMDNRLTFAAQNNGRHVMLFFRDPLLEAPVKVLSQPDLDGIIARLGGMGAGDGANLSFSYGEVVAILQALVVNNKLTARDPKGRMQAATFQMQEPARVREDLAAAGVPEVAGMGGSVPQFGPAAADPAVPPAPAMAQPAPLPAAPLAAQRAPAPVRAAQLPPLAVPANDGPSPQNAPRVPAPAAPAFAAPPPAAPAQEPGSNAPKF